MGFSVFQLLSRYAVKEAWITRMFFFFAFVNVLYKEHKYQNKPDGYQSHLWFLMIANRKTNRGCFGSFFVSQLNDTKRETKGRHVQKRLFFCFLVFDVASENENRHNGSYSYIHFSDFKKGKMKRKLDYPIPIFHYGIGERKPKGRYIQHMVLFRFSCFQLVKEKTKIGITDHLFLFFLFAD